MLIRAERDADRAAIHAVNAAAFPTPAEADLVNALRQQADPLISLVAERDGAILGHILFSPVTLEGRPNLPFMGLASSSARQGGGAWGDPPGARPELVPVLEPVSDRRGMT
ncbi:MAG TPA: hypothetical protein VKM72_12430 [Thermoanaerobaculia bacterium]|nr:hypothetical protein [Thermoanaerobaculia bacterium]